MPVLGTLTALLTAGASLAAALPAPADAPPEAALPAPADARFAVAVYCDGACEPEAMQALERSLGTRFTIGEALPTRAEAPELALTLLPAAEWGRPDADYLSDYGLGLGPDEAAAIARSEQVVLIEAAAPRAAAAGAQATLNAAALRFAEAEGGWLEDLETREVFSREQWQLRRVAALSGSPAIQDLIRIESYPSGDEGLERMLTYGLGKLGLPELAAEAVHPAFAEDVAAALLLAAALGAEGRDFTERYTLDLSALEDPGLKTLLSASLWTAERPGVIAAGEGRVTLGLVSVAPAEGDKPWPTLQLSPGGEGSPAEQLGAALDALWGYGIPPEEAASPSSPGDR